MEKLLFQLKTDLDSFLEEKRVAIARLFFVADEEVLELFAICHPCCASREDFALVLPIFEKLFAGVKSVEHDDEFITAMVSRLGEKLRLVKPVAFKTSPEDWLLRFEESMKVTVELSIQKAYETFDKVENRIEWIKSNPAQASIVVTQIKHAEMVEKAIHNPNGTLNDVIENVNNQLADLTKESLKTLSPVDRCTIQNLIIIQVHNRDLLCNMISQPNKNLIEEYYQLRYYIEDGKVIVRMMTWEMEYGYEYLSNYDQLVITPLTDRAYRTIIAAKQHHFGAAPQGPAGTGKTETTRDLARALGMNCVVINSSDQIDEKVTAQIFKGALASGSWVVFDEFNRIVSEVLVNIGEQLKVVKEHRQKGASCFEDFCGTKNLKARIF